MLDFIYISIALVYTVLLIFVFKKDLKAVAIRYFILFLIGLLFWHITLYLYLFVSLGNYLLFIGRLNYATGPIFSLGLLGFFYYFPIENFRIPKWIKSLFWIVTLALVGVTLFTPFVDKMETPTANGPVVTLGDGYYIYLADVFLLPVITLILGGIKNFTLKGLHKLRFQYSFWVFVPTMIAFLVSNLILPIFGIIDQFVYSPVFLFPIVISAFYAIAKYRFLDIRTVLVRAVTFVIFIFICAFFYTLFLFTVIQKLLNVHIDLFSVGTAFGLAIFAALTFQPALAWLYRVTNKLFYKGRYESEKLLAQLSHIMTQTIDLPTMTSTVLEHLMREVRLIKGAFFIFKENKINDVFTNGYKKNELVNKSFQKFFAKYIRTKPYFIFEELPEGIIKNFLREHDISMVIPIKVENTLVAVLLLGPKLSGEVYTVQDINFLNIFASQAGIAIQNAQSYQEIKKFSQELERRVEDRTKELKESQERELAKAKDIARLKDEFVFVASHELRTPVTAIKGFLELVLVDTDTLPKETQENLHYMSEATEHLNQLINDLLEIARAEAGQVKMEIEAVDIVPVLQGLIQELSPQANQRQIKVNLLVLPNIQPVMVDGNKIKEVIMNLLSNAIKYNRDQGSVDLSVFPVEGKVMIEVRDTGYGIPKEQQDKIFQKFFRARNERTNQVMGTGLGLFITQMLVEKMGGKITFTSTEGQGSTFAILLPCAEEKISVTPQAPLTSSV